MGPQRDATASPNRLGGLSLDALLQAISGALEMRPSPAVRARVLAVLHVVGASLALIWLILPHGTGVDESGVAACVGGAYAVAAWLWMRGHRFSRWTIELELVFTIVGLISGAIHFGGPTGDTFALFYVLAALYAFAFLPSGRALLFGGLIAVAYAGALLSGSHPGGVAGMATSWVVVVGVSLCAGGLLLALSEGLRRSQRTLAESERRYRLLFERNPQPMWLYDTQTLRFLAVNDRAIESYGYTREEFLAMSIEQIRPADDVGRLRRSLEPGVDTAADESPDVWRHVKKSGAVIDVEVLADSIRFGRRSARLVVATDITERLEAERRLRYQADHDALTGLWNRRRLERELNALLSAPGENTTALAVFDLDHFKFLNDSFGHAHGDELLVAVAEILSSRLPAGQHLCRLGGDEFALIAPGLAAPEAREQVGRMLADLRARSLGGHRQVTASAGVVAVTSPAGTVSSGELLVAADIALYQAKDAGRDRHALASAVTRGQTWIDEIRAGISEDRLVLHAQPIIDLASGRIEREELLVRMLDSAGELIAPAGFIPAAERFGLINQIDRWVVGQALELAAGGRRLEVNLSAHSLGDDAITRMVADAVAAGLDPDTLVFEITETAAAANFREAADFAARLAKIGCGFALDDFGTGFGSLSYLKHVPFAHLKIDTEFVRGCSRDEASRRIIRTVVQIAAQFGQSTIAEGVEDEATIEVLRSLGVDQAQGFHIARPEPVGRCGETQPMAQAA